MTSLLVTDTGIITELQNKERSGFQVDDKEAGLLQTSFIVSFMVFSPIFGYLGDRYTRKYLMAVGLLCWSAFVLAGSFSVVRNIYNTPNGVLIERSQCAIDYTITNQDISNEDMSIIRAFY